MRKREIETEREIYRARRRGRKISLARKRDGKVERNGEGNRARGRWRKRGTVR